MKKLFLILFFVLFSVSVFAQNADIQLKSQDNRTWLSENYKNALEYPITLGAYGFFNYSVLALSSIGGVTYGIGDHLGGGGAITAKVSIFSWLAVALDLSISGTTYNSTTYDNINTSSSFTTFLLSPTVIFQRETKRGEAGWVPWVGIGFSISNNSWKLTQEYQGETVSDSISKAGFGFIINAGVKYNMKNNAFVGVRTDYSASTFSNTTMNNWRLGLEAGYRF